MQKEKTVELQNENATKKCNSRCRIWINCRIHPDNLIDKDLLPLTI
ncbi:hypothetical protein CLV59_105185 [Chitinophaga dinghuensis]|uniref:Uncharacterized protein n=1 Tax=Chitinophaga dinghuensis TaxID=1539050 RepID=A0A327W524_9BACT|nr:hypothetical protein CLV59_105185 [Chitinophaga dinghuensis]